MTLQEFKNISDSDYQKIALTHDVKIMGRNNHKTISCYKLRVKTVMEKVLSFCEDNNMSYKLECAQTTKSRYIDIYNEEGRNLELRVSNHTISVDRSRDGRPNFDFIKNDLVEESEDFLKVDCGSLFMSESEIINLVKEYFA